MDTNPNPRPRTTERFNYGPWLAAAALGVAGLLAWHFYPRAPAPVAVVPPPTAAPAASAVAAPAAQEPAFPISQVPVLPDAVREALPLLDQSDEAALALVAGWLGGADPLAFLQAQFLLPRLVATVDNLPRTTLTPQVYVAQPVAGELARSQADGRDWLDAGNFARYDVHVALFEALDARAVVSAYVHWYPLLQQAYRDLGVPDRQFNDRLVEVIDHLLAAPELAGPIALVPVPQRPRWAYADARLEQASVGHKALWRMGPDHAARVKAKLREFRALLAGQRPVA